MYIFIVLGIHPSIHSSINPYLYACIFSSCIYIYMKKIMYYIRIMCNCLVFLDHRTLHMPFTYHKILFNTRSELFSLAMGVTLQRYRCRAYSIEQLCGADKRFLSSVRFSALPTACRGIYQVKLYQRGWQNPNQIDRCVFCSVFLGII